MMKTHEVSFGKHNRQTPLLQKQLKSLKKKQLSSKSVVLLLGHDIIATNNRQAKSNEGEDKQIA